MDELENAVKSAQESRHRNITLESVLLSMLLMRENDVLDGIGLPQSSYSSIEVGDEVYFLLSQLVFFFFAIEISNTILAVDVI